MTRSVFLRIALLFTLLAGTALAQFAQPPALVLQVDAGRVNIAVQEILDGPPPPQGIPALGFAGSFNRLALASPAPRFVSVAAAAT